MSSPIQLPYALKPDGYLVSADQADRDIDHICPNCSENVTLRRGEVRVAHFSHRHNSTCSTESATHKIAKRLVAEEIEKNARGVSTITLVAPCEHCDSITEKPLPLGTFTNAQEEAAVDSYRIDVVAYRNDTVALCIEVHHTHAVGLEKSLGLQHFWVELEASEIIHDANRWRVVASKLKPIICSTCKDEISETLEALDRFGFPKGICTPIFNPDRAAYVASLEQCWKCKQDIPVFWWDGVPFAQRTPPVPRPKTILYRYSKQYGGKYWMNTCPHCRSSQGDNHLFLFEDGVLRNDKLFMNSESQSSASVSVHAGRGAAEAFIRTVFRGNR